MINDCSSGINEAFLIVTSCKPVFFRAFTSTFHRGSQRVIEEGKAYVCGSKPLHHLQSVHHTPHVLSEPLQSQDDLLLQVSLTQPLCTTF